MEYFFGRLLLHARSIWNHRWLAIAVAWLAGSAAFIIVATLPHQYQSAARVDGASQSILRPLLSGMTSVAYVLQQVSIISRTLLSRPNLEQVILEISGTGAQDIYTISYSDHERKQAQRRDVRRAGPAGAALQLLLLLLLLLYAAPVAVD